MVSEDNSSAQDAAAVQWAVRMLKEDPEATYKELRREARSEAGLSLSRRAWTAARRELGLISAEDAYEAGDVDVAEGQHTQDEEEAPRRQPMARESHPPRRPPEWQARPHPPAEEPERRRPAWAQGPRQAPWAQPLPSRSEPAPPSPVQARTAIEFMVEYLRTVNMDASFQEVQDAATRAGFTIYPATFGRAQAMVGLVESSRPLVVSVPEVPKPRPAPALGAQPASGSSGPAVTPQISPEDALRLFFDAYGHALKDRARIKSLVRDMLFVAQEGLKTDEDETN